MNTQTQKICCAGFGGQGALLLGKIIATAAMTENLETSWSPSYGPEMRGGTANCHVILSKKPIGSPVVTKEADCLVAMNQPSFDKYVTIVKNDGIVVSNSDLVNVGEQSKGKKIFAVPANSISTEELGSAKFVNMVLLGATIYALGSLPVESIDEAFKISFSGPKEKFIATNKKAFDLGYDYAKKLNN